MDLSAFESRKRADDGVEFALLNTVTGETVIGNDGKPVVFRLGNWDGPRIRAAVRARRKQRDEDRKSSPVVSVDPEDDREKELAEDLAYMTLGWSDNFDFDGKPCKFSNEVASDLYYRCPEIMNQMARHAADRTNFLFGLAKT